MQADETRVEDVPRGSVQHARGRVYADVDLDDQPVEVRVKPLDWQAGTWYGAVAEARAVRSTAVVDTAQLDAGVHEIYARFEDNSETPIVFLGVWRVTS